MIELKKLQAKADKIFSEYIRRKDAIDDIARCCTCGELHNWKYLDCGHFLSRRYLSTRYEETNCAPQCKKCNVFNQGEQEKFRSHIIKHHGKAELLKLRIKQRNIVKDPRMLYGWVIDYYSQKLEEMNRK